MKKILLLALGLFGLIAAAKAQSVSILVDAGLLENALGTANEPTGGLLQLLASPGGTFSAPTSSSYTTGDNVLVASFPMNSGSGVSGETLNSLTPLPLSNSTPVVEANFTLSSYTLTPGEQLLLRFYPSLTYSGAPSTPTLLTSYGQVRSSTIEFGSAGGDPLETPWVVPAAGNSVHFDYITSNDPSGGTYSPTSAEATNVVLAGVPEPSTYASLAFGLAAVFAFRARNLRGKAA